MSLLLYDHLASGASLYTGFVLLGAGAVAGRPGEDARFGKLVEIPLVTLGAAGVLLSSVPVSRWLLIGWCGLFLAWQGFRHGRVPGGRRVSGVLLAFVSLGVVLLDLPYQWGPAPPGRPVSRIAVIGDSLSTGVHRLPGDRLWPAVLERRYGVEVLNLSRGGARLADAIHRLDRHGVPPGTDVVLLEIGGNDLLEGTPVHRFRRQLNELLSRLDGDYVVFMFELPLPPLGFAYGRVQRRLAGRYGVRLIPKHHLSELIFTSGLTLDGLHPSREGHRRLAFWVADLLGLTRSGQGSGEAAAFPSPPGSAGRSGEVRNTGFAVRTVVKEPSGIPRGAR